MFFKPFLVYIQEIAPVKVTGKGVWMSDSLKSNEIHELEIFEQSVKLWTSWLMLKNKCKMKLKYLY